MKPPPYTRPHRDRILFLLAACVMAAIVYGGMAGVVWWLADHWPV